MKPEMLALFLMLGQTAQRVVQESENTAPSESMPISEIYDLSLLLPSLVKESAHASYLYRLFFVFENYVRDVVLETLSEKEPENWWSKVPADVQQEVEKLEQTEEQKQWMALTSRSKLSLTTLPQLLRIIDETNNWKSYFEPVVRDKSLIQSARAINHIRNTICHMSDVSDEEVDRVKQVIRDWFRVISP